MELHRTALEGVVVMEPVVHQDSRGWFMESWSQQRMEEAGLPCRFVQDNHSYSARRGTLRGLHFQCGAAAQAKLVRCVRGALFDVAVDLRKNSPTFGHWAAVELSADNHRQLFISRGFAHGFLTLTDDVEFLYKVDNAYAPEAERVLRWDDPDVGIAWPLRPAHLSPRDANAPPLRACGPLYGESG